MVGLLSWDGLGQAVSPVSARQLRDRGRAVRVPGGPYLELLSYLSSLLSFETAPSKDVALKHRI